LRHILNRFVREVQEVVKTAERDAESRRQAPGPEDDLGEVPDHFRN